MCEMGADGQSERCDLEVGSFEIEVGQTPFGTFQLQLRDGACRLPVPVIKQRSFARHTTWRPPRQTCLAIKASIPAASVM